MLNVPHLINALNYIYGIIYSKEEVTKIADIKKQKKDKFFLI